MVKSNSLKGKILDYTFNALNRFGKPILYSTIALQSLFSPILSTGYESLHAQEKVKKSVVVRKFSSDSSKGIGGIVPLGMSSDGKFYRFASPLSEAFYNDASGLTNPRATLRAIEFVDENGNPYEINLDLRLKDQIIFYYIPKEIGPKIWGKKLSVGAIGDKIDKQGSRENPIGFMYVQLPDPNIVMKYEDIFKKLIDNMEEKINIYQKIKNLREKQVDSQKNKISYLEKLLKEKKQNYELLLKKAYEFYRKHKHENKFGVGLGVFGGEKAKGVMTSFNIPVTQSFTFGPYATFNFDTNKMDVTKEVVRREPKLIGPGTYEERIDNHTFENSSEIPFDVGGKVSVGNNFGFYGLGGVAIKKITLDQVIRSDIITTRNDAIIDNKTIEGQVPQVKKTELEPVIGGGFFKKVSDKVKATFGVTKKGDIIVGQVGVDISLGK